MALVTKPGWRVAHAGGNVTNGATAGFATLNANNDSGNRNTNVGAHGCFTNATVTIALPLGKTQSVIIPGVGTSLLRGKTLWVKQTRRAT